MSLSSGSFAFVRDLMRERCCNALPDDKAYLVETRLLPVALRLGFGTVEEFVTALRARGGETWVELVLEAMFINETSFFRDGAPFEVLRRYVLPELIGRRAAERRLLLWSAACSSGQEPYSLAMLLREFDAELAGWTVRVIASDLSTGMIERARQGWYSPLEAARGLTEELRQRWFRPAGGGWQLAEEVRAGVEFVRVNLGQDWPVLPTFDLVVMRNVLIYFDVPDKKAVLRKVRRQLRPDGYFMLGTTETTHNLDDAFELVPLGPVSFYRPRGS